MDKDWRIVAFGTVSWMVLLCTALGFLTGCSQIEGDGFVNDGKPQPRVVCKKITPSLTRCYNR